MKAIAEMTTAEMVAEYNALTGKDIKKFSSRAAGEKQLAKVRSEVSSTSQAASDTGKANKVPAKSVSVNRSKSISESWNNPEVSAKRVQRHNVKVEGAGVFRSVLEAFKILNLPQSKHIKFRMALKQVGSGVFEYGGKTYEFTIVEKQ
jgi:hypothetical protein